MKNLSLLLLTALLCGCISSSEPFYTESSKVKDDRLIGTFTDEKNSTSVTIEEEDEENYIIKYSLPEGDVIFSGTLFELGDDTYIDIVMLSSEFEEGGSRTVPGPGDFIKRIFMSERHVILGIEIDEGSIELKGNDHLSFNKFRDSYVMQLQSVDLLKRIQMKEDLIHVEGDPAPLLPSISAAYQSGDIFQQSGTLTRRANQSGDDNSE